MVMTWHEFLYGFIGLAALLTFLPWPRASRKRSRILRASAMLFAIMFFVDYPAEDRLIWQFADGPHASLIRVPIENMIITAASAPYTITLYLLAQILLRRRTELAGTPKEEQGRQESP